MDSTAQTAPKDSVIINETSVMDAALLRQPKQPLETKKSSTKLLPRVTHGFDSENRPRNCEIIIETAATGDAWIQ